MPVHDWGCTRADCTGVVLDRYQARNEEAEVPACPSCGGPTERLWSLTAKSGLGDGDLLAKPFRFAISATENIEFSRLSDVRRFERDSERAVAAGVPGAQPYVFRHLSQSRSNQDRNVFGDSTPPPLVKKTRRGVPFRIGFGDPPRR